MQTRNYKRAMAPFLMYLSDVYRAEHPDKDLEVGFGNWIEYISKEEIINYGNDFVKLILKK